MSARLVIAGAVGVLLNLVLLSAARSSEPPEDQVDAARAYAETQPATPFPCKWVDERTCVALDLWVQMMGAGADPEERQ